MELIHIRPSVRLTVDVPLRRTDVCDNVLSRASPLILIRLAPVPVPESCIEVLVKLLIRAVLLTSLNPLLIIFRTNKLSTVDKDPFAFTTTFENPLILSSATSIAQFVVGLV